MGKLDKELDNLNTALDHIENWSKSLHEKVADLLQKTREQNEADRAKLATLTSDSTEGGDEKMEDGNST